MGFRRAARRSWHVIALDHAGARQREQIDAQR
jgi:hypothetical protein